MTLHFENLKPLCDDLLKYIENLNDENKKKFCNLGLQMLNNKSAKAYWIAGAICKHYILDKQEKIYVVKTNKENYRLLLTISNFSKFKKLGRIISKII